MQAVVVHPGTVAEALADPQASQVLPPAALSEVILPSRTLDPAERLAIYQGMYPLRMEEALATDYSGLKHFLGADEFFALVQGYVQVHPSRSFTLNPLGRELPEYLLAVAGLKRRAFAHDLSRLERAMTDAFDAPHGLPLSEGEIAAVAPEAWEGARLEPVAAFQLLAFRYPVGAWLDSRRDQDEAEHGHRHPSTRRRDTYAAVYRRDYAVYRHDLSRAAHDLLGDLVAGRTLGEAVAAALRRGRPRPDQDQLFRWFRQWVAAGVFAKVVGPEGFEPSTNRL
jgi:putative DNA-binding protein